MKIISWNVNGIRAIAKKDFFKDLEQISPDILCLQETKAQDDQVSEVTAVMDGYQLFSSSAEKKGYSGTAILTKQKPLGHTTGIGIPEHDTEGRVISLEMEGFYLVNVYVPNSGNDLHRLGVRQQWDLAFFGYLKSLEEKKPVLVCGDFNVAHRDIDLARPKGNYNKSAGYMQEEIDGMDRYTSGGFVDTFRHFHPGRERAYTWWSFRSGAREKNVGWRIDYFLASRSLIPSIRSSLILPDILGSDHCPIGVEIV
jgi:exodeoxyribonuclease-3